MNWEWGGDVGEGERHGVCPGFCSRQNWHAQYRWENWQDYLEFRLGQVEAQKYLGKDFQQPTEYRTLVLRREACPEDTSCGNMLPVGGNWNLPSESDPPPHEGEDTKWEASLTRTHWYTTSHTTGKGRTAGERDIPEHNGRGHAEREAGTNGMKCSLRCRPRKRTTEKCLLVWAGKWSLENLRRLVSTKWLRERARRQWIKKEKQGAYTIFWGTLDQKGRNVKF